MARITAVETFDVRFPTSRLLDGSDAMNPDPDYSAAYVTVRTDVDRLAGHGFAFTIGRGNEIQRTAIESVAAGLPGRDLDAVLGDLGAVDRDLVHDSQFRWLGPEKGVIHMAAGAILNALWDLRARHDGKPALADAAPSSRPGAGRSRRLPLPRRRPHRVRCPHDSRRDTAAGRDARAEQLLADGYPAYATSPGWLGYTDDKMVGLCVSAVAAGSASIQAQGRRQSSTPTSTALALTREDDRSGVALVVDANQAWDVGEAIEPGSARLRSLDLAWVEEPTAPDDVLGHAHPAGPSPSVLGIASGGRDRTIG